MIFGIRCGLTYAVAAAVNAKICSRGDGSAEPEESVEEVEADGDHGYVVAVEEGDGEEVEEGQHAEDCDEDVVVDHGAVSGI